METFNPGVTPRLNVANVRALQQYAVRLAHNGSSGVPLAKLQKEIELDLTARFDGSLMLSGFMKVLTGGSSRPAPALALRLSRTPNRLSIFLGNLKMNPDQINRTVPKGSNDDPPPAMLNFLSLSETTLRPSGLVYLHYIHEGKSKRRAYAPIYQLDSRASPPTPLERSPWNGVALFMRPPHWEPHDREIDLLMEEGVKFVIAKKDRSIVEMAKGLGFDFIVEQEPWF